MNMESVLMSVGDIDRRDTKVGNYCLAVMCDAKWIKANVTINQCSGFGFGLNAWPPPPPRMIAFMKAKNLSPYSIGFTGLILCCHVLLGRKPRSKSNLTYSICREPFPDVL